jgi:hypothetical protein
MPRIRRRRCPYCQSLLHRDPWVDHRRRTCGDMACQLSLLSNFLGVATAERVWRFGLASRKFSTLVNQNGTQGIAAAFAEESWMVDAGQPPRGDRGR